MFDCDGMELRKGDRVAVQSLSYKELMVMFVIDFTPKMVCVHDDENHINPKACRKVYPRRVAKVIRQRRTGI